MPSKKTTTPARAARRAASPVPTSDHRHPSTPLDDSHRDPQPDPRPPRPDDPADVLASVLIESAMVADFLSPDDLRGTAIVHVRLAAPEWVQPIRRAWTALISGEAATSLAEVQGATRRVGLPTVLFLHEVPPDRTTVATEAAAFEQCTWNGACAVGISPNAAWLPADLVASADQRLDLGTPTPTPLMLTWLARRLTGADPADEATAEEASHVTPRLVRLARRAGQTADDYLGRLRSFAAAEAKRSARGRTGAELMVEAVHEAGRAIAALELGLDLRGISRPGGSPMTIVGPPSRYLTAADVHARVVLCLSGRAAEEVVLGRVTSAAGVGSGSGLETATRLVVRSILELGLEEDHGLTWSPVPDDGADLAAMLTADRRLAFLVRDRLASAYMDALNIAEGHSAALEDVSDRLMEGAAPDGAEIRTIVAAKGGRS